MKATRSAVAAKLANDATLVTLLGGAAEIYYRASEVGEIEDGKARITYLVPMESEAFDVRRRTETVQIDVWSHSPDLNDDIAERIRTLFNHSTLAIAGSTFAVCNFDSSTDLFESDVRIHHKAMTFRVVHFV